MTTSRGISISLLSLIAAVSCVHSNVDALPSSTFNRNKRQLRAPSVVSVEIETRQNENGGRLRRLFSSYFFNNQNPNKSSNEYRGLKNYYNYDASAQNYNNDDVNNDYYAAANGDDDQSSSSSSSSSYQANNLCTQYLISFLEGTTDTKDNCEGYQNAYTAAYCENYESMSNKVQQNNKNKNGNKYNNNQKKQNYYDNGNANSSNEKDDDHDDYFINYNHMSCCQFLKGHYDAYCYDSEIVTNMHLLLIATILLVCEMAKSLIKFQKLHWMPEAGGCIIVGVLFGLIAQFLSPHSFKVDDLSFSEDLFLCILLPPIIFEAALSVNKFQFKRRRLAIFMFAAVGTILSTFMTGLIVHYGSAYLSDTTIPLLDSFIFGSLISSIDPVAILSVLSNLSLTEKDTIFIMVFGESLLNDGVAITLFKTLLLHYNGDASSVSTDEVLGAIADFFIVGVGSIIIGLLCGFAALIYFWLLRKKLNASMEVASFFLWAGIPYYICDECNLSGIVAIVTIGFFMDVYIAKPKDEFENSSTAYGVDNSLQKILSMDTQMAVNQNGFTLNQNGNLSLHQVVQDHYVDLGDSVPCTPDIICQTASPSNKSIYSIRSFKSLRTLNMKELILREERFRLTTEADRHVRFVAHLLSSLSENCIFVYLGLFLYSKKYVWDFTLVSISIFSCVVSRAVMVVIVCHLVWYINILRQRGGCYKPNHIVVDEMDSSATEPMVSRTAKALQDRKIQLVLILAGLRGAVSLALVESVPIYNGVTGGGSNYKGQMKAMTSASIMFTIFIIGGSSYYILKKLNIESDRPIVELASIAPIRKSSKWKEAPKPEEPLRKSQANNDLPDIS